MNRRIATIAVCIGLSSPAFAVEWSLYTTLRESLEISDNPFLRAVPSEGIGSTSTLVGNLTGRTKTSRFDFDADVTYRKYWGPAADGASTLAETNNNGVRLHYETYGVTPGDKNNLDAIWRRRSAAVAILDDFGFPTNVGGELRTTTVQGGIERALTSTDFWALNSRATSTDYVPASSGTQYYDVITSSTFRHQSNRTTALTGSTDFDWLKYDNLTQTNIMIIRYMAGFDTRPFKNVRFVASAGAATIVSEQGNLPTVVNPTTQLPSSGVATGFVGDATLTYKFWPTTELALSAGQSIGPTVIGAITQRQYASATIRHDINSMSSLTARVNVGRQIVAGSQSDFIGASATYNRTLARDWTLNVTYQYSHRAPGSGNANANFDPITGLPIFGNGSISDSSTSNSLFIVLSKRFAVLPRRT